MGREYKIKHLRTRHHSKAYGIFLSSFFNLRESVQLSIGRNSLKVYLSCSNGFLWRIFPLLRANRLYVLFSPGLKVWLLFVQDTFCLPLPRVLTLDSFAMTCVQQPIFFFPTSALGF